jgi:hypothetical protein
VEEIPYNFRLSGSFLSMIRFLQTLENQKFNSEIENFQLSSDSTGSVPSLGKQTRTGRVTADIRAAFYAKEEKK